MNIPTLKLNDKRIKVGVVCCYEHITKDGYLFHNMKVDNGHNSLKPFCDLYEQGKELGLDFLTLDQVSNPQTDVDAVIFMDRHKPEQLLSQAMLQSKAVKILLLYECPLIKPDNWDTQYHQQFDYIFTWNDDLVDGKRYIKNNFVTDRRPSVDFEDLKGKFQDRKLACMINSYVNVQNPENFPTELYTQRIRAIRWFEVNAPHDFDLYGMGWDETQFPSYRGRVDDKHATFSKYRFAICLENATGYPGYISEKIQDCLLSGAVPVYAGAPNISRWIPADCFIDLNAFSTFNELHAHLHGMDSQTHSHYLNNIQRFLTTSESYPFSTQCFVNTLCSYVHWGVLARRDSSVQFGSQLIDAKQSALHQTRDTLQLTAIVQPPANMPSPAASSPGVHAGHGSEAASAIASINALKADDIVIAIPYGLEHPVYTRARSLWQWYASHFKNLQVIFFRGDCGMERGTVSTIGDDLVIGLGLDSMPPPLSNDQNPALTGAWTAQQNENTIFRQMCLYDYLLQRREKPFRLFTTTVTSVVDFRGLVSLCDYLPKTGCFAGMLGRLQHHPYKGIGIVHGANTLLSDDVMRLLRNRYVPGEMNAQQPNDHWQGILLQDVERTAVPLFSFNQPRPTGDEFSDIGPLTQQLLDAGHFHFRIKTKSENEGYGRREDVDPWIMLRVMETILRKRTHPASVLDLQQRFAISCDESHDMPRNFPINDEEAATFYP
jgi:hypothetical protein